MNESDNKLETISNFYSENKEQIEFNAHLEAKILEHLGTLQFQEKAFKRLEKLCGGDEKTMIAVINNLFAHKYYDEVSPTKDDNKKASDARDKHKKAIINSLVKKAGEKIHLLKTIDQSINRVDAVERATKHITKLINDDPLRLYQVNKIRKIKNKYYYAIEFYKRIDPAVDDQELKNRVDALTNSMLKKIKGSNEKPDETISFTVMITGMFLLCKEKAGTTVTGFSTRLANLLFSLQILSKSGKEFSGDSLRKRIERNLPS